MRTMFGIVAILVVVGAVALHYGFTRGELNEWQPGRLPYPGVGLSSYDTFRLYRGGRFELQVLSPGTAQERDAAIEDVVTTGLRVVISGPHGFHIDKVLSSMRVGSWSTSGRTFSPNEVWVLPPGEYEIRIEGSNPPSPVFRERGAVIYLERMEPVGPDLGIELSRSIGYFLLAAAALIAGWLAVRKGGVSSDAANGHGA